MKNIQNIQEAVQSQQAYMMVLSGHTNTLYTKLVHLDRQIDTLHIPTFTVRCNTCNVPDYDPDIDREPDSVIAEQPLNAESVREDMPTDTSKSEDHTTIHLATNRPEHQPSEVQSDIHANEDNNPKQQ